MRRRPNLRASDGVAMTEFALIVPVFLLIVAGMLGFGRALFYWIDANHLANETARWAVVDRNPFSPTTLQQYARNSGGTVEFTDASVCISFPDGTQAFGHPLKVTIKKPFTFVPIRQRRHDQHRRLGNPSHRARRRHRLRTRRARTSGRAHEQAERQPRRRPRPRRGDDSTLPARHRAHRRRRQLVRPQAPTAEPCRRGGARSWRPVPGELPGMHHEQDPGGHHPSGRAAVRRRSCGHRTRSTQRSPTRRIST